MIIDGKTYKLKYGIRAMVLFERIADKPFSLNGTTDWVIFIYAMLLAGDSSFPLTLDEFMDKLDEDPKYLSESIKWTTDRMRIEAQLMEPGDGKKKQ